MTISRVVLLSALLAGCTPAAHANLQFATLTSSPAARGVARANVDPTRPTFDWIKMRLLSVYLEADRTSDGNPVGVSPLIWLNPVCQGDNDTGACNVAGSGALHEVTDYFDFTDATQVNAALNSQALPLAPGDYKYVSVDFCDGTPVEPNMQFQLTNGVARSATSGVCGVHSVEANPPITVAAGGTVTVTLAYDLQQWLAIGDGTGNANYDGVHLCDLTPTIEPRPTRETAPGALGWCVASPVFVPSFAAK